jgi:hypothetical protein
MDLLIFNQTYNVLICTSCKYAIHFTAVARHLYEHHKAVISLGKIQEYARLFTPESLLPAREVKRLYVLINTPLIIHLQVYNNAHCCRLCPSDQPFVIRDERLMINHLREIH